jgi:fructose-1,6-bisphosphatase/inositol monophosphatase family enzyme
MKVNAALLLECFDDAARAVREAVTRIDGDGRRARTEVAGQYALDLAADAAALPVLRQLPVRIVSEESGVHDRDGASITVVLDPVDGSTNCARGISYWATSICALDGDGPLAALIVNHATGTTTAAVRGEGTQRDGARVRASNVERVEDAVIAIAGSLDRPPPWKQFRALGCAALALCDVAAGGLDGSIDAGPYHAPWDYLGGYLACVEAGAVVRDARGADLVTVDTAARRQLIAAATPALADALMPAGSA